MIPVKVVLTDGDDELELGPFNQGVVFEDSDIIDVASGKAVVTDYKEEADHEHSWTPIDGGEYPRAFVKPAPTRETAERVYRALFGEDHGFLSDITIDAILTALGGELEEDEPREPNSVLIEAVKEVEGGYQTIWAAAVLFDHVLMIDETAILPAGDLFWRVRGWEGLVPIDRESTYSNVHWSAGMMIQRLMPGQIILRPLRKMNVT